MRVCEQCGGKQPPFVPRKRMEDGSLVCSSCASGRPGGGNTQASMQTMALSPRDADVLGIFNTDEDFLISTRNVKGLTPHDREEIYRSMVALADEDVEIRPLTWEQAKKEKVQVDSALHTAARSREDVLLMADRLQQMVDRRDCDFQLLNECVALLDDLYDEGLAIMGKQAYSEGYATEDWSQGWARKAGHGNGPSVWGEYVKPDGTVVRAYRGARNKVRFYDAQGNQHGPEQVNVAPATAYAESQGWYDAESVRNRWGSRRTAAWEQYGDVWINETADYDLQVQPEGDGWVYMVRTPGRETISGQVRPDEGDLDDALDIAEAVLANEFGVIAMRRQAADEGDLGKVRVTQDYRHPDGYLFWRGETFHVMGLFEDEVEVKTAGDYVVIPRSVVEVIHTGSRKHAHDSGDGETIYHCPFCGSGQVTARSDGSAWCEFCRNSFTVQVQPEHNSMPQTQDGQPVDMPGMPGEPEEPDWERPVQTEIPEQFQTEPEVPAEHPMPNGQVAFRTSEGHLLDRDAYLARLALRTSPNKAATLAKVRGLR